MKKGDYVLATKYNDGDPGDHYAVGWFESRLADRYIVVDSTGKPFRANGFRKCQKITDAEGRWLVEHFPDMVPLELEELDSGMEKLRGESVWDWLAKYRRSQSQTEVAP